MGKYCANCGKKLDDNADACLNCGTIVNTDNKKCGDCGIEMITGVRVYADHPFEVGIGSSSDLHLLGKGITGGRLKSRICPKCGKVELYINPDNINNK